MQKERTNFFAEMVEGFKAVTQNHAILILVILISFVLFYTGLIQALFAPMVLSFTTPHIMGILQSICAVGMLLTSVIIGTHKRKVKNVVVLAISLGLMGFFFMFIGIKPNVWSIILPGFLFFATLPYVNSSIDVLIRQNISNEKQGRIWSLISVITYFGAIVAYAVSGFLADKVFNPLFMLGGKLAGSLGAVFKVGQGRGIACMFFLSGIFIMILSLYIFKSKLIRQLELK